MSNPEQLLRIPEVADRLSVSRATVYRMIRDGVFLARRRHDRRGTLLIAEADVSDYLNAREVGT